MKWCVLTKIIYFISKWRCFYVIIDKKKGLMISRLVIIDLPPPKRPRESLTMLPSSKPKTSVISLSYRTRNIPLHILFVVLLPRQNKGLLQRAKTHTPTRHVCHKITKIAGLLPLSTLKHCKGWSSASMDGWDPFFDIKCSTRGLWMTLHCPLKTRAKDHIGGGKTWK
jgi:hypothetical protein